MKKGICLLSMVPVRETASDRSQMLNQLLFGDRVDIKDQYKSWLLIESEDDTYAGWVDEHQITLLSEDEASNNIQANDFFLADDVVHLKSDKQALLVTLGSRLPGWDGQKVRVGNQEFVFEVPPRIFTGVKNMSELIKMAHRYVGSPYLWGGRSLFGIDCSGFTQIVFRMAGHKLPRDSADQAMLGTTINFIHEAKAGDLAFFENEEAQIVHVGILLGDGFILHASGEVRKDRVDHEGIYNENLHRYTHKLRIIKRVV
jgi:hypothetical protein